MKAKAEPALPRVSARMERFLDWYHALWARAQQQGIFVERPSAAELAQVERPELRLLTY